MPSVSTVYPFLSFFFFFFSFVPFLCPADSFSFNKTSCDGASGFSLDGPYEKNRRTLLDSLVVNASVSRFSALRVGEDPNSIYGLMRCRAYVSTADCQTYVDVSAKDIVRQCPNERRASALYEYCSIQYSDKSFFSEADGSAILEWASPNNASNLGKFDAAIGALMSSLSRNASTNPLRIAAADSATIHAMVQCSASLDNTNCSTCLQEIISHIPSACPEKDGCRVVTLSCDLRYEDFPFSVTYEQWFPLPPSGPNSTTGSAASPNRGGGELKGLLFSDHIIFHNIFQNSRITTAIFLLGRDENNSPRNNRTMKPLSISLRTLKTATGNFSDNNKLGEGEFGPVYKGILPDGQQIAVKRLSNRSSQGMRELKTEVLVVAKLLHRNLVRVTGFCLEEEERLLVYEFLQNGSLDKILFDNKGKSRLNWELRYGIIVGIARGLQYLHEDSQMGIIHRDLKASNILLDQDMNPKVSDFGLAKLFPGSQTQGLASRIAGTCGYMAPEYVGNGHISTKCDVYSYGVLVLEIVTGRRNSSYAESINLPNHAWRQWTNRMPLEILDPSLGEQWPRDNILKCIQIGLLCTQDSASDRPTMSEVVLMLNSYTIKNPAPKRPAFFPHAMEEGSGSTQAGRVKDEGRSGSYLRVSVNDVTISKLDPR
ncbi:hypothetical protein MLD38_025814 [Melastoma candidum]|uniref:Uncharacterized protein n=1 Tax=Melastoma candidum TaxID=119954 RepID=A0ACB9NXH5_9MYRT|nr:hypothetical protein MLD38_025814 [Melastoma candidum]